MTDIHPMAREAASMCETAEQSAELKQALKKDLVTDELRAAARRHPLEADEAYFEALDGRDSYDPGAWVAEEMSYRNEGPTAEPETPWWDRS